MNDAILRAKMEALAMVIASDSIPVEAVLEALQHAHGFTFGDAVRYFSERMDATERKFSDYAHENLTDEGDLEFDSGCMVSMGADRGAYVMGWKWVDAADAGVGELELEQAQVAAHVEPN